MLLHMEQNARARFSTKDIWLWSLYDFANSIAFIGVTFYFGLWFVRTMGGSDAWMSSAIALSTLLLLFVLPVLGHVSDRRGRRMPFLSGMTCLCILSLFGMGILMEGVTALTFAATLGIITLYFCFQFFYQGSFAFYDAYLRDLSGSGVSVEKVSGMGMTLGQLGNLVGLALLMPFGLGKISLPMLHGTPAVFIVGGLCFLIFFLPTWIFLKEKATVSPSSPGTVVFGKTLRATLQDFSQIRRHRGVLPFLIAYYLFADALLTLSLFATVYLDVVGDLTDVQKNVAIMGAVLAGVIGGWTSPLFVRWCGGRKRALNTFIVFWGILVGIFAMARSWPVLALVIILNGFVFSVLFALSRAFYALLIPREKQAAFFSVYVLFERTSSILGPLLWSATAALFQAFGDDRYRFSVGILAFVIFLSLLPLQYVPEVRDEKV